MNYILTENNHNYGIKGLLISRDQYVAVPFNDKALFELVGEMEMQYYYCKLTLSYEGKLTEYIFVDASGLAQFLVKVHLHKFAIFVDKEIAKGVNASVSSGDAQYVFSPILSA